MQTPTKKLADNLNIPHVIWLTIGLNFYCHYSFKYDYILADLMFNNIGKSIKRRKRRLSNLPHIINKLWALIRRGRVGSATLTEGILHLTLDVTCCISSSVYRGAGNLVKINRVVAALFVVWAY